MRNNKVYFVAGFSPSKGMFSAASYLHQLEDEDVEFTRFYMTRDGKWGQKEIKEDIVSVSYTKSHTGDWSWWLLGKRGTVISLSSQGRVDETVPDAGTGPGKLGYLSQIKLIEGNLYACGLRRQVYKRQDRRWVHIDAGMLSGDRKTGFEAIDGTGSDNIHAVGEKGEVWYYDGAVWRQGTSPTNLALLAIKFVSPNLCYASGKQGIVLRGYQNQWTLLDNDLKQDFWGLEYFKGQVYLMSPQGLCRVEGDRVATLDTGRKVEGRRLYANVEELWSMEHHELWVFDGVNWREVPCPDNT